MNGLFLCCLSAFLCLVCGTLLLVRPVLKRPAWTPKRRGPTLRDDVKLARGEKKEPGFLKIYRRLGGQKWLG